MPHVIVFAFFSRLIGYCINFTERRGAWWIPWPVDAAPIFGCFFSSPRNIFTCNYLDVTVNNELILFVYFYSFRRVTDTGIVQQEKSIMSEWLYKFSWSLVITEQVGVTVMLTQTSCSMKILAQKIWNGI